MQIAAVPPNDLARTIADAYRWHRRLGNTQIVTRHCHIVADPSRPEVWDSNHADEVTAQSDLEMDEVFDAMNQHLAHTNWRVVHTDLFTPDLCLTRLAQEGYIERPVTIQLALHGKIKDRGSAIDMHPVTTDSDWQSLLTLVIADHAEGLRTGGLDISPDISAGMVAAYKAKSPACQFYLAMQGADPSAYGACAAAPNGAGMIEDLFTLQSARRQGIATAMIAAFSDQLRDAGCHTVFLGALAGERAQHLYARLGFLPVTVSRSWVREVGARY